MKKDKKLVILFGSQASGKGRRHSDVDVAVLSNHPLTLQEKAEFGEKVAKKLGIFEDYLDIADLWLAPPLLQLEVAKNGKLIEGNAVDFLRFKVLAWKRYQDTAKFRRLRKERLNDFIYSK